MNGACADSMLSCSGQRDEPRRAGCVGTHFDCVLADSAGTAALVLIASPGSPRTSSCRSYSGICVYWETVRCGYLGARIVSVRPFVTAGHSRTSASIATACHASYASRKGCGRRCGAVCCPLARCSLPRVPPSSSCMHPHAPRRAACPGTVQVDLDDTLAPLSFSTSPSAACSTRRTPWLLCGCLQMRLDLSPMKAVPADIGHAVFAHLQCRVGRWRQAR